MKKSLIALAALAAASGAFAQSSVTLFGVVDLAYENVKTNAGRISGLAPSANSSSRIGFRGVEDLGGGLSASFWLEAAINPASGIGSSGTTGNNQNTPAAGAAALAGGSTAGGLTFNRRSTVSLAGGFGELRIGRDYTPSFWNYTIYDPFGTNSVGATIGAYTGNGMGATFVRASNSIGYFLPGNLGGFYGQAMYAWGNRSSIETTARPAAYGSTTVNTEKNGRYAGLRVGYGQGPINTAIAYGRTTYAPGTFTASVLGLAGVATGNFTDLNWGGSYQFGSIKAMAQIFRQKDNDAIVPGNTLTSRGWGLGADWGVGAGDVLVSYSRVNSRGIAATPDARATKWALGYVHNLSKRTAAYAYYARVNNSGGAAFTAGSFSSGGLGSVAGASNANGSSTGIDIGLRHAF
jgi:predicted porin